MDSATQEVVIIETETIKPYSPTSPEKKSLKLSIIDQMMFAHHVPILLVYSVKASDRNKTATEMCQQLKITLSKTLVHFYPLAGKVVDNSHVDCDDSGVKFIQATTKSCLEDYFTNPDPEKNQQFSPTSFFNITPSTLLFVQVTFFRCGGMVIAVDTSHKFADLATMGTFIKSWSSMAVGDHSKDEMIRLFVGDSYFPQWNMPIVMPKFPSLPIIQCERKRFVFDSTKLAALKTKIISSYNSNISNITPTRFEIVSSLIWKCATKASRKKIGRSRPSIMFFAVELRKRFSPPLPETYGGNLMAIPSVEMHQDSGGMDLKDLINEIRKEIFILNDKLDKEKMLRGQNMMEISSQYLDSIIVNDDSDRYTLSSWCNFRFNECDFGWGKPTLQSFSGPKGKNNFILLDTKDNKGIEAWISLEEDEMKLFESDLEIQEFAKVNPLNTLN